MSQGPRFIPVDLRLPSDLDGYQHSPLDYCVLAPGEVAALLQERGAVDFDAEVVLARHYAAQLYNQRHSQRRVRLADELTERLEQINFLCESVAVLLRRHFHPGVKPVRIDDQRQLWFMIYLYAESFYSFAHRVQEILKEPKPTFLT